jgi:hypothetical protein
MRVAQVPRLGAVAEHRAIVLLRVSDQARILFGEEVLVLGDVPVAAHVLRRAPPQVQQLCDDVLFARSRQPEAGRVAIAVHIGAKLLEAGVSLAGARGRCGIDGAEIAEHRLNRRVEAVEIEPVEADAPSGGTVAVEFAQPAQELDDDVVPPHPARKARESVERARGPALVRLQAHPPARAVRVRPVRLDGDDVERVPLQEGGGEIGANAVELLRPMGRFADQDDARAADRLGEPRRDLRGAGERNPAGPNRLDCPLNRHD